MGGTIRRQQELALVGAADTNKVKVVQLFTYRGLARVECEEAPAGEILAIAGLFALLVAISSIAAKERCCRCCLPVGSGIGMILALGEVFLGIAAWAKPATVLSWLQSMEDDSPESVPRSVSEHFVSSSRTVAVVLWVMASLQFIRAVISLVIECHHWRQRRQHARGHLPLLHPCPCPRRARGRPRRSLTHTRQPTTRTRYRQR